MNDVAHEDVEAVTSYRPTRLNRETLLLKKAQKEIARLQDEACSADEAQWFVEQATEGVKKELAGKETELQRERPAHVLSDVPM